MARTRTTAKDWAAILVSVAIGALAAVFLVFLGLLWMGA